MGIYKHFLLPAYLFLLTVGFILDLMLKLWTQRVVKYALYYNIILFEYLEEN